jgi:hypothetical protein
MTASDLWWYFWCAWFVLAGASFAFIAAVVLVRGFTDLREMIRILEKQKGTN